MHFMCTYRQLFLTLKMLFLGAKVITWQLGETSLVLELCLLLIMKTSALHAFNRANSWDVVRKN